MGINQMLCIIIQNYPADIQRIPLSIAPLDNKQPSTPTSLTGAKNNLVIR